MVRATLKVEKAVTLPVLSRDRLTRVPRADHSLLVHHVWLKLILPLDLLTLPLVRGLRGPISL
jgi:hypothetical protein